VEVADEPAGHLAEEPRQAATIGWVEDELADTDVPGEIAVGHDPGQVAERLDGGVVERVLLGGIEAVARRAAETGDVEEGPGEEGHVLTGLHDGALVGPCYPHVVDDQQVRAADLVRREPAERQDVGRHPPVPGLRGERAVVSRGRADPVDLHERGRGQAGLGPGGVQYRLQAAG
jgi:hypothetical protein